MAGGKHGLCAWCFDLMAITGKDLRSRPLLERRIHLRHLLAKADDDRLRYSDEFDDPISSSQPRGWLADPTTMLYGLAGWTGAEFKYENVTDNLFFEPKEQFWANGLTVGGGLEKKLAPNWSTRFEYRYTHFLDSDVNNNFQFSSNFPSNQTNTIQTRFAEDMQMGRIGISYLMPVGH